MAVKEVRGKADNNIELIFIQNEKGLWETTVPFDSNEKWRYIVEIYAVDFAGNWSYVTAVLFVFDLAALCWHMIPIAQYSAIPEMEEHTMILQRSYEAKPILVIFMVEITMKDYFLVEVYPCRRKGGAYG